MVISSEPGEQREMSDAERLRDTIIRRAALEFKDGTYG